MGIFHVEEPANKSSKCKFIKETLKDAFFSCHVYGGKLQSIARPEDDLAGTEIDDEDVVSEIRSRAMEKLRNKTIVITDGYSWVFSPKTGELFLKPNNNIVKSDNASCQIDNKTTDHQEDDADQREEFFSVASCFSCNCSSSKELEFLSARTNFSCSERISSIDVVGFQYFQDLFPRRSVIQEFCHCEGWPFGLGRKAVLLPPLPTSPSESWTWRKHIKINVKMHLV